MPKSYVMSLISGQYEDMADDITDLPIADGLKEALLNSGFTRNQILTFTSTELASILEIDQYVANLIRNAAKE
jgi:hypothetical protein